ncbi:MAG: GspE/PulE family protein [Candidatus Paceibacterota bacterium]
MVEFNEDKQLARVSDFKKQEQEHLAQRLAKKHDLPYADLSLTTIKTSAVSILSEEEAREGHMVIFEKINQNLKVGVQSPDYEKTKEIIEKLKGQGFNLELYVVSNESLRLSWKLYEDIKLTRKKEAGSFQISQDALKKLEKELESIEDVNRHIKKITQKSASADTSEVLEVVLAGSLSLEASDLHFEPTEQDLRLRYRIDGSLVDIATIPKKIYSHILSRVKLLSGVKLNIGNQAQDGRFSINVGKEQNIEIRTSIIPGGNGESIVLRILDPDNISIPLEKMGMREQMFNIFIEEIHKPNGMILTTGPTGSGKTTTLYASMKKIYTPEKKILTIENPIEYHLEGIVQTQTDHARGYTFSEGLRSALRQDPDVIMVGEIRDEETAEIAVNAALTGHLVFSTLHTNNAAGTFPRLIDLGINDKTLGSAINLSMAQRLVRKVCRNCAKKRRLKDHEKATIEPILTSIEKVFTLEGVQKEWTLEPVGCDECHNTGYKGRIGVYEGIKMDQTIEDLVINNPSEREIQKAALSQGILNMQQDGVLKVLEGITSYEEIDGIVSLRGFQ